MYCLSFQQDGHKGSRCRTYIKTDFPSWQQKHFPISSLRLENKVPCPDGQLEHFVNLGGIHTCKSYQDINFQLLAEQTVQDFDGNKYRKTTRYLLKSCPTSHLALGVRKQELLLLPGFAWWIWRSYEQYPSFPVGLTLFHAEQCQLRSRSWVDSSHGSQFLWVLWPKPATTAFPSVHLQVWDCHYWKWQKCRITPGPLPKGTFFNVMLISLKKEEEEDRSLYI